MLDANRLILDELPEDVEGELIDSRVEGRVVIEPGARLERATRSRPGDHRRRTRRSPTPTSARTRAIGDDVRSRSAEVEYSIVLSNSSIRDLEGRIEASLIGRNVTIAPQPGAAARVPLRRRRQRRDRNSLNIALAPTAARPHAGAAPRGAHGTSEGFRGPAIRARVAPGDVPAVDAWGWLPGVAMAAPGPGAQPGSGATSETPLVFLYDSMRVLVTGAGGMLGQDVVRAAEFVNHEVVGVRARGPRRHRSARRPARDG